MGAVKLERLPIIYRRVFAFTIDLIAVDSLRHAFFVGHAIFVKTYFSFLTPKNKDQLLYNVFKIDFIVFILVFMAYFTVSTYLSQGKTLGKLLMKLKVVNYPDLRMAQSENLKMHYQTKDTTFLQCFLRSLGQLISYLSLGALFFINFLRKDHRGLADFLSDSEVVNTQEALALVIYCPVIELNESQIESNMPSRYETKKIIPEEAA